MSLSKLIKISLLFFFYAAPIYGLPVAEDRSISESLIARSQDPPSITDRSPNMASDLLSIVEVKQKRQDYLLNQVAADNTDISQGASDGIGGAKARRQDDDGAQDEGGLEGAEQLAQQQTEDSEELSSQWADGIGGTKVKRQDYDALEGPEELSNQVAGDALDNAQQSIDGIGQAKVRRQDYDGLEGAEGLATQGADDNLAISQQWSDQIPGARV